MRNNATALLMVMTVFLMLGILAGVYFFVFGVKNQPLNGAQVAIGGRVFQVEAASTAMERARGLSGRDSLRDGEGMFFIFNEPDMHGFWMKDMKFPIDIIWIKGDGVVGFSESAAPEPRVSSWRLKIYHPPEAVDRVLEINAGLVRKYGLKVGDKVVFREL